MSAIAMVSLLTAMLFIPFFTNEDVEEVDDDTPIEPEIPVEPIPDGINGTVGNDLLTAQSDEVVNGLDGNDTLSTLRIRTAQSLTAMQATIPLS